MGNPIRRSCTLIIISLILSLVTGIISTIFAYLKMTDGLLAEPYGDLFPMFFSTCFICIFLIPTFVYTFSGLLKLSISVKNTIIERQSKLGFRIFIVGIGVFVLFSILTIMKSLIFIYYYIFAPFITIFLYPLIHISIAVSVQKLWGKYSIMINVLFFVVSIPMIHYSISNDNVDLTMFLMATYYLVPFIINIIAWKKLSRWATRMERIQTLSKKREMILEALNKLKADKEVRRFPEKTYKNILSDHNDKMNEITKEIEGIEAKIK